MLPADPAILLPEPGTALHGVFIPDQKDGDAIPDQNPDDMLAYTELVGYRPNFQLIFFDWTYKTWDQLYRVIQRYEKAGEEMTFMVGWEPRVFPESDVLNNIASGKQDRVIRNFAEGAKAYGKPIFLRWGHEMNGNWYSWSGAWNKREPERYIAAWRHVYNLIENEVGATNIIWVWGANCYSVPTEDWNAAQHYYPGDEYVDWVGCDFYGMKKDWGRTDPGPAIDQIYKLYGDRKPMMITESAAADEKSSDPGFGITKAGWIKLFFEAIKERPNLRGFVWFNINKEADWRVNSDPESLEAFKLGVGLVGDK